MSTYHRINAILAIVVRVWGHGEAPTCIARLLFAIYSFIFVVIPFGVFSSSVLSLMTSLMTGSLMPLCGLVLVFLTFSLTKFSPLPTLHFTDFHVFFVLVLLCFL